jgi:tetratricopeptide (TPR) repeat protein
MPTKKYLCTNLAGCDKALGREPIEIPDDEEAVCPSCGKKLEPIPGPTHDPRTRIILAVVLVLIAAGILAAVLLRQSAVPPPKPAPVPPAPAPVPILYTVSSCKVTPLKNDAAQRVFLYLKQGMMYASSGKMQNALSEYQQGLLLDPEFLQLHMNAGAAEIELQKFTEAENDLNAELKLANCLSEPGVKDEQLASLAYFIEVPEKDPLQRNKALAAQMRKKIAETKADTHYNLACLYAVKKNQPKALDELRQAIHEGFADKHSLAADPSLRNIRSSPEFQKIITALP